MKQQTVELNGLKINYIQNKEKGKVVVFVHGNSLSSQSFKKQFDDQLLNEHYRLIALDLPGHGESSRAEVPERTYSFSGFVSILLEFVEKLNLNEAVFVGHSLGGNMLLDASTKLTDAKGFVVFGAPPIAIPPQMEKYFLPNPVFPLAYKHDLTSEETEALASAFVNKKEEIPNIVKDIKRTHPEMRAYLGASITPENHTDQVEIIENIEIPIAIIHGKDDQLVNGEYFKELNIPALWQKEVIAIPDSGHCPQLGNPKEFNLKLRTFLDQIF